MGFEGFINFIIGFTIGITLVYLYIITHIECPDTFNFELIAGNLLEEHPPSKDYVCRHYSWELQRRLNEAGYKSCYVHGDYVDFNETDGSNHAWIVITDFPEMMIESTKATVIPKDVYEEKYIEYGRDC